jgi:hypothetical protein
MDDYVQDLSRECDVALIDARDWIADEGFADIAHLTPDSAATFTRRFALDVLRPLQGVPARSSSRSGQTPSANSSEPRCW